MQTVRQIIDCRADQQPLALFMEAAETGRAMTYAQLREHCQRVSLYLDQRGIAQGETVAFLMDNGLSTACLFLGVMYAGRVVLPLNAVAGVEQLQYVIAHSQLKLMFLSSKYQAQYAECILASEVIFETLICDEDDVTKIPLDTARNIEDVKSSPAIQITGQITDQATALLIYTSGTTGRPKGVLLSHQNVIAGGTNTMTAHGLKSDDKGLCVLPLYHINAEMVSVMATLVAGSSLVMAKKLSVRDFWCWIGKFECTWFSVVPTIISYLIEHSQKQSKADQAKSMNSSIFSSSFSGINKHLRFGRSASAALAPATHRQFEKLFDVPIIETMGISECAAQILSNPVSVINDRDDLVYGSAGLPVGNEVDIFDQDGSVCADQEIGEIWVRGDNVMKGYLNDQEATAKALDEDDWFHTGDLGYRNPRGYIFVTGRLKELIIRGGENISPHEIDNILYQHPDVLEAAAFAVADRFYGQEVMACVALKEGATCDVAELSAHCSKLLGDVKTPKQIRILDELPKGPSGKIQRLKLVDSFSALSSS